MEVEEEEEEGTLGSPPLVCVLASSLGEVEARRPDAPRREADVELGVSFLARNWHEAYSGQGDTELWVKEGREVEGPASDSHTHPPPTTPPPISLENTASPFRSWFSLQRWRAAF